MKLLSAIFALLLCIGTSSCRAQDEVQQKPEDWIGVYTFGEYAPPNQNWDYKLEVFSLEGSLHADLDIDGFQTLQRYRLSAEVLGDSLALFLLNYRDENIWENPAIGTHLLTLYQHDDQKGDQLLTYWRGLKPMLPSTSQTGVFFYREQ